MQKSAIFRKIKSKILDLDRRKSKNYASRYRTVTKKIDPREISPAFHPGMIVPAQGAPIKGFVLCSNRQERLGGYEKEPFLHGNIH